jgi:hypothetical protein
MRRLTLSVLSLAFLAGCQPATTELTEEQKAEISQEVEQAFAAFWSSFHQEADIAELISYASGWAGSPWGCCGSLEAARSYGQQWWARLDHESVDDGDMSVMVLGPDAAAVRMISDVVTVDSAGVRWEGTYDQAAVMVRETGQWKLLVLKNTMTQSDT